MLLGNPTHHYWERLLIKGMPFIKAELLHANPMGMHIKHWPLVMSKLGGDVAIAENHISFMSQTRSKLLIAKTTARPFKPSRLNCLLCLLVGRKTYMHIRAWNARRRAERKAKKSAVDY